MIDDRVVEELVVVSYLWELPDGCLIASDEPLKLGQIVVTDNQFFFLVLRELNTVHKPLYPARARFYVAEGL